MVMEDTEGHNFLKMVALTLEDKQKLLSSLEHMMKRCWLRRRSTSFCRWLPLRWSRNDEVKMEEIHTISDKYPQGVHIWNILFLQAKYVTLKLIDWAAFDFGTQRATLETCDLETFDQTDEETWRHDQYFLSFGKFWHLNTFFLQILENFDNFDHYDNFDNS